MRKKISIILSFYNEEKNIKNSLEKLVNELQQIKDIDYEIICVNDCSTDNSLNLLIQENIKNNRIKIINLSRRFGHMPGIMAGLRQCTGDAAIYLDIDLQDPPDKIKEMVHYWINEGYDVVYTTSTSREDSFFMRIISSIGYKILKKTTYIGMSINSGDFRLISRRVINEYKKFNELDPFFRFIVDYIGFKKKQIFYDRKSRNIGKSNFSLLKIFIQFFEISLAPFSNFPIRFAMFFGFFSFLICTFILLRTGYLYLTGVVEISTISIFGAILFFGSFQSLVIGLLAIYIGLIFKETKKRPLYIVDSTVGFEKD